MKILIVDDTETMRVYFERLLNGGGYDDVVMASGAMEAFEILGLKDKEATSTDIDLIIMDVVMPGISGLTACKKIRQKDYLKSIPIVMVSGREEESDISEATDAGATDYLVKPVNKDDLHRVMSKFKEMLGK